MTILAMPLDEFDSHGKLLEVQVPWLGVTLWFVSEERDAEAVADGAAICSVLHTAAREIPKVLRPLGDS
jgi:hypothetical protein